MRNILHELAIVREATELISVLIKQFDSIDIEDYDDKWTPLVDAVFAGNYENVKLFIVNGADVNYRASMVGYDCVDPWIIFQDNANAITLAAGVNELEIAKHLIKNGAEVDTAGMCTWKPLVWAALYGHSKMVKLFINNGAEPDVISLHHAAVRNHTEVVWLLLNNGVRDECLPCERPPDMSKCFQNIVRFHHCNCETALFAAVSTNNLEMTKLILQYGHASVNCKHSSGRTPLMVAIAQKKYSDR
jgi:ankyrin repeat protein